MGRTTVMTDATVTKLEYAFAIGATDTEACSHAEIARNTYYRFLKENPEYNDRFQTIKDELPLKAKAELSKLILAGDPNTVKWYLERVKRKEYSTRTELDNNHTFDDNIKVTIEK